jgi:hypothetical protein
VSEWTKKEPMQGGHGGCLHCGYQYDIAPMDMIIAVGFGCAQVTKNGRIVYDENRECKDNWDNAWTTQRAEEEALKDPDNDWQINMQAPLSGRTYQRQGDGIWALIDKNIGFA